MPGRDPEARDRSAAVAAEIRAEMKRQGLTGVELRERVERFRGAPVADQEGARKMWLTRRLSGDVNLVRPVRVVYGPTEDLALIARALKVNPERFVRVINLSKPKTSKSASNN
jgi:hypothetical protein